jgi:hypothetical protein
MLDVTSVYSKIRYDALMFTTWKIRSWGNIPRWLRWGICLMCIQMLVTAIVFVVLLPGLQCEIADKAYCPMPGLTYAFLLCMTPFTWILPSSFFRGLSGIIIGLIVYQLVGFLIGAVLGWMRGK